MINWSVGAKNTHCNQLTGKKIMGIHQVSSDKDREKYELQQQVDNLISEAKLSEYLFTQSGIGMGNSPYVNIINRPQFNKKEGVAYSVNEAKRILNRIIIPVDC